MSVGQALPAAPRRLPWRKVALAGLAVVTLALIGLAVAGFLWLRSYAPLAWAGGAAGGPDGSLEWKAVHGRGARTKYLVSAEQPGTFEVGFDLTNNGRLPVRVEGLEQFGGFEVLTGLRMGSIASHSEAGLSYGRLLPFVPVTIEPGDARYLVLQFRLTEETACGPDFAPGTSLFFDSASLRYSYARAFERTATVATPFAVELVCGDFPPHSGAPGA